MIKFQVEIIKLQLKYLQFSQHSIAIDSYATSRKVFSGQFLRNLSLKHFIEYAYAILYLQLH